MEGASRGVSFGGGETHTRMSADLSALAALPEVGIGRHAPAFTPEENEALLKYWPIKSKSEVARILGVSEDTARKRYRELIREGKCSK